MYWSIVSAIASASSSSKYTWSESRLKSGDLNSSRLRVLKCLLDDQNSRSDDRYAVSNGGGYAVLIRWDEYVVLDRELDTPYPIEVDKPYSTVDQNSKMPPKKRTATTTTTTTPMTDAQLKALIAQGVADALAERDADRSRNVDVSHDPRTGRRRQAPPTHECTYSDFLKCQPLNVKGTEGVVGLTQWFEKMEFVFYISNCTVACQIKFATCTLQGNALTWWNSHAKTVTHEVAYAMTWKTLKKMMTDKYFPRGEIKKLEIEMWNLKVKGTDVVSYNQCFQELSLMCSRMFPEESDEIEKYVGGLPDMIH
ncbi:reverse transcriptase domain-containing protein [Tanacetum coccineum]